MPPLVKQPQPGQTMAEIEAWADNKFPGGKPHEWERKYANALYGSKPSRDNDPAGEQDWFNSLSADQKEILKTSNLQKEAEAERGKRDKFRAKYCLSEKEAIELWALRDVHSFCGLAYEFEKAADKFRQRYYRAKTAKKNIDHSKLTSDESKELRKKQNRESQQKKRAEAKRKADLAHQAEEAAMQADPNFGMFAGGAQ